MAEFFERVKELRETSQLTQDDVAKQFHMSVPAYQLYEYGKGFPTVKRLIEIADFFNVSLDYLVGRSDVRERR